MPPSETKSTLAPADASGIGVDQKVKLIIYICSALAVIVAFIQAYGSRDLIYPTDGITYLDISDFILHGQWHDAISSHWCPLYPTLLAVVRYFCHSNTYWEPAVVQGTNFVLYLILIFAFNFFLKAFLDFQKSRQNSLIENIPLPIVALCLYCWFLWSSLVLTGVYVDTPDQMSSAALLVAASIVLRIKTSSCDLKRLVVLGLVLGVGYLSKAAVLPIALVYFAILFFLSRTNRIKNVCLSLASFLIIAGPWIATISSKVGHFTFSDSARWNYRVFVEHSTYTFRPLAPFFPYAPRIICTKPTTFEFATPVAGTYPLWTDPIYWQQGPPPKLSPIFLSREILANAAYYFLLFGLPLSCALLQFAVNRPFSFSWRATRSAWILWLPGLVGVGMYMPLITMTMVASGRYLTSFVILLAAATIASLSLQKGNRASLSMILLILFAYPVVDLFNEISTDIKLATKIPSYRDWHIATELSHRGLQPGSRVAVLGSEQSQGTYRCAALAPPLTNLQQSWYYWARLAHVKIVAQITRDDAVDSALLQEGDYLKATPADRAELYHKLKLLGVKAIVWNRANRFNILSAGLRQNEQDLLENLSSEAPAGLPPGWSELDKSECYVYMID